MKGIVAKMFTGIGSLFLPRVFEQSIFLCRIVNLQPSGRKEGEAALSSDSGTVRKKWEEIGVWQSPTTHDQTSQDKKEEEKEGGGGGEEKNKKGGLAPDASECFP